MDSVTTYATGKVVLAMSPYHYSPAIEPRLKSVGETLIIVGRSYFSGGMIPLEKSANNILNLKFIK